ncbi:MAG: spore coat U domain-containing protein [Proteobacteria bacterium]|nr:spore coat U domain-containing protein [Pseudomonadota bacterium]
MKRVTTLLGAVAGLAIAGNAHAATATGNLNVSITITASCSVVSATNLDFGSTSTIGANIDQTSTLTVNCTNSTPYTVALSAGGGAGATVASRKLTSGGNTLNYSLYRDAARTQLWGVTTGTDTAAGTGTGANQTMTIYGRVPSQASPVPGAYTDTVTVTITY